MHPRLAKETLCFNLQKGYCLGFIEELPSMGAIFDGLEAFLDQESAGSAYQRALRPLLGVGEGAPSKFEILAPGPTLKTEGSGRPSMGSPAPRGVARSGASGGRTATSRSSTTWPWRTCRAQCIEGACGKSAPPPSARQRPGDKERRARAWPA
ncbi:unnamed protein product [Prorocentrum cordatum]|uniref:Uncharacterized protein n=1 Tax=Prorocentrum cordatum TaxID=2364126 RepID=A0ABN9SKX0_9DINO|nr:unnamed protein product [Polarella glacialis]